MACCGIMIMAIAVTHGRDEDDSIGACSVVH
jgi:hypothetical protein